MSTAGELFEEVSPPTTIFSSKDVNWIDSGMMVPYSALVDLMECDPHRMRSLVEDMVVTLKHETSRNEVLEDIIQKKLGSEYTVSHKPTVPRQGQSYSPFSRSRHDLCIQHNTNHFKSGVVRSAVVGSSVVVETGTNEEVDGDVITSIVEFKAKIFSRDQVLAQMMCTLTDTCVDVLKKGRQINQATVYGLSVNYSQIKAIAYKMTMDFCDNSLSLIRLRDELSLSESLNYLISAIS